MIFNSIRLWLKKVFAFPPPTTYGAENDCALQIDLFKSSPEVFTWEDYYKVLRKNFPMKYLLLKKIPDTIIYNVYCPIAGVVKNVIYFVKCHTVPSKKYHLLSLSQPKTNTDDDYKYGWLDADHQMLFACMNILVDFVERERGIDAFIERLAWLKKESDKLSEEDRPNEYDFQSAYDFEDKVFKIYTWWTVDRKNLLKEKLYMQNAWFAKTKTSNGDSIFKELNKLDERIHNEEQEMLKALVDVRGVMWT